MKRTIVLIFTLIAIAATLAAASPAFGQHYSCSNLEWPDQIASIYENIEPACVETLEIDGVRYGRFVGRFVSERAGEVTLRFEMPDGNTLAQTFKPPKDFRVQVDGRMTAFHQLKRGQEVTLLIPEQR